MPTPLRLDGVLAKKEVTYGVDPTPVTTTNGVRIAQRLWSRLRISHAFTNFRDDAASGGIMPLAKAKPMGRLVDLEIVWDAKGSGAAYAASTDIEADPLLQACGLSVAVDATGGNEKVTYSLADTGHASCTIWGYAGGQVYKIVGCRGNVVWPIRAGQFGTLIFRMRGIMLVDPATASLPAITYEAEIAPNARSMALAISGWSPEVQEAELDLGNDVLLIQDANAAEAIGGFEIPERTPRFNLTGRTVALATYNPHTVNRNATLQTLDWTLGSAQYNRIKLDVNEMYLEDDPESVDVEKFAGWRLNYRVHQAQIIFD